MADDRQGVTVRIAGWEADVFQQGRSWRVIESGGLQVMGPAGIIAEYPTRGWDSVRAGAS